MKEELWVPMERLIVICEPALEKRILALCDSTGVSVRTVSTVRGQGWMGQDSPDLVGESVRLDLFCNADVRDRFTQAVNHSYLNDYDIFIANESVNVLKKTLKGQQR